MRWFAEFVVDDTGFCRWREGMRVDDPALFDAYRQSPLLQFIVEASAQYGVKVGQA